MPILHTTCVVRRSTVVATVQLEYVVDTEFVSFLLFFFWLLEQQNYVLWCRIEKNSLCFCFFAFCFTTIAARANHYVSTTTYRGDVSLALGECYYCIMLQLSEIFFYFVRCMCSWWFFVFFGFLCVAGARGWGATYCIVSVRHPIRHSIFPPFVSPHLLKIFHVWLALVEWPLSGEAD